MSFQGKYVFDGNKGAPQGCFILRDYYDGSWHGVMLTADGGIELGKGITAEGNTLSFSVRTGGEDACYTLALGEDGQFCGKAVSAAGEEHEISGQKLDITAEDDKSDRIEMKKKALILYASITGNTGKIASAFQEGFEHYGMDVTTVKVTNKMDWSQYAGKLFVDDYDVVCLGSPIIGGSPMKSILSYFSAGAASALEDRVAENAAKGLSFNVGGAGGFAQKDVRPEESGVKKPEEKPMPKGPGNRPQFHKPDETFIEYPGGPQKRYKKRTLGIAFTTYGGGFRGSDECLPVLELLTYYLEEMGCRVIGKYACCGKEFGPAGLDDGIPPVQIGETPVYYKDADGKYHAGSFFYHCHMNSKPNERDVIRAKGFVSDIVEDHFYTSDGLRREPDSIYYSIS